MLSAVELHSGSGSGFFAHHPAFSRQASSNDVQYTASQQMSGTEFARPKPKNIVGGSNTTLLNGLSQSPTSPTHKYSHHHEQNGPVNLAVNHQAVRQALTPEKDNSDKEIDVVGLGNLGSNQLASVPISFATTSSSRISSYPAGLGSNAYQALNYSFYGNRYR
jgi:hypothetical protein